MSRLVLGTLGPVGTFLPTEPEKILCGVGGPGDGPREDGVGPLLNLGRWSGLWDLDMISWPSHTGSPSTDSGTSMACEAAV